MSDTLTISNPADVAAAMLANVPTIPEPAQPSPAVAPEIAAAPAQAQPQDAHGHLFRPGFHRVKDDGSPFVNTRGDFMPRGGRKPAGMARAAAEALAPQAPPLPMPTGPAWTDAEKMAAAAAPVLETPAGASGPQAPAEPVRDGSDDAAEVFCRSIYAVCGFTFDAPEDCQPRPADHENMKGAVCAYLRSKGWKSTAGIGILLMLAAYLLRIVSKPAPAARVRGWVANWKANKAKPIVPIDPAPEQAAPAAMPGHRPVIITSLENLSERSA